MKVRIKRIDKSLPLPQYETAGAVGFDFLAREEVTINPQEIKLIPGNVIVEVPKGYALILASRSSTPKKHGLTKPHGIGVIDQDYCGPEDEVKIQVYNFTDEPVTISRGTENSPRPLCPNRSIRASGGRRNQQGDKRVDSGVQDRITKHF